MKNKRILAMILCCLLTFASCQSASDETEQNQNDTAADAQQTDTAEETETETETEIDALLADAKFDGYEFKMLARDNQWDRMEVDYDEPQADVIADAVYRRNLTVEEKYDVKVTGIFQGDDMVTPVRTSVTAGTHEYDMVFAPLAGGASMSTANVLIDYNTVDEINLENPWWDKNIVDDMQICDKMYFMTGDIGVRSKDNLWIILFNNPIHTDLGLDNLYDMVYDGTWTIDKFNSLAETAVLDLDGNGEYTRDDRYGLITTAEGGKNFFYAAGQRVIDNNNGEMTLVANNEQAQSAIEKIVKLFTEGNVSFYPSSWQDAEQMFAENKGLFYSEIVTHIINLRYMEADFGILPTPKLSESQENYYTHCASNGTCVVMPATSPDVSVTGTIVEALGCYGMKYLTPAFEDVALSSKYSRDEQSAGMLDIIWDSVRYDVGYLYNVGGMGDITTELINRKSTDLQSLVEQRKKVVEVSIKKLVENFSEE
ncbi:MAG: hypothetical protein ACI4XJ_05265 [Eubacteriales bacterium]